MERAGRFYRGEAQSRIKSEKGIQAQPEVKMLPSGVLDGVRRVPVLLRRAGLSRSGIMQVRGPVKARRNPRCPAKKNGRKSQWPKRITEP